MEERRRHPASRHRRAAGNSISQRQRACAGHQRGWRAAALVGGSRGWNERHPRLHLDGAAFARGCRFSAWRLIPPARRDIARCDVRGAESRPAAADRAIHGAMTSGVRF